MNEQIRELAAKAGIYGAVDINGNFDNEAEIKKFAELIVRKCAMVGNYAHDGGEYPGPMIKEYFGVE